MARSSFPASLSDSDERYELLRRLGRGSAGAVYLARDRETGEHVAFKKLLRMDAKSVLRVKREFRALAGLNHRNLVQLYDLGRGSDAWFLTMEYLEGTDLLRHLGLDANYSFESDVLVSSHAGQVARKPVSGDVLDAFHQLAHGIQALHEARMLHRDLKPSNVMVVQKRVVVLDFGLVRELNEDAHLRTLDGSVCGTPAYMAPEQVLSAKLDEAADWYAFGVMLYEVLSGQLPVEAATTTELLWRKTNSDPAPLKSRVRISRALKHLCMDLLQRDPTRRPDANAVLRVLADEQAAVREGAHTTGSVTLTRAPPRNVGGVLFGREQGLAQLRDAFRVARGGTSVVAHVSGSSGAGKSTLVEHFLELAEQEAARVDGSSPLILRGRCYERESMPFKALDGIMEMLVRKLEAWDDLPVGHLLPTDVAELAKLFPMFERLAAVRRLAEHRAKYRDAIGTRMRGEQALGEMLARLAAQVPLVVWIDDLQWGDLDSASILVRWRTQLANSPFLLVISYRSEEIETSSCLSTLLAVRPNDGPQVATADEQHIKLAALGGDDLLQLSETRLGELAAERPELIGQVAKESRGNPFLVAQLAALAHAKIEHGDSDLSSLSIEQLVVKTSALLPTAAREILNVLAIAGRPLAPKLALRAVGLKRDGRALLHALHSAHLIRTRQSGQQQLIEVYHDRVREGVHSALTTAERTLVCERLLQVLEEANHSDVDWLHSLAHGAGHRAAALRYGLSAAARASDTLAFERAVELYEACLTLIDASAPNCAELWHKYALALGHCRRGVRAAEAFLETAKRVEPHAVIPLLQHAASHFLRSGDFERGDALTRKVLATLQLGLPERDAGLIAAIGWERVRLAVRGLEYKARPERDVSPALLQKVDMFATLSIETQASQPLRAALIQARCLRWALQAGEPRRVARALCVTATMSCVSGSARAARRSAELLLRAERIARDLDCEPLLGDVLAARAICASMLGRLRDIIEPATEADRIYRESQGREVQGDYYHRFAVVLARVIGLFALGEVRTAAGELRTAMEDARAVGNRSAALHLTLSQTFVDESQNQMQRTRERLLAERSQLPKQDFGPLHIMHMVCIMRTAAWLGDFAWAEPLIAEDWPRWQRSLARRSAGLRLYALGAHARYLLNRHVLEQSSSNPTALVRADLRAMNRLPVPGWRIGLRGRVLARLAYLDGKPEVAADLLRNVITMAERESAVTEALRDRFALGYLVGGDEGSRLRDTADRRLRDAGVVDPHADARANYPEFLR